MENLCKLFWERERETLSPYAFLTSETKGRRYPSVASDFRTEFQRDRDRIIHSKSFRRLMHKTQVFFAPSGEHYRTRMTHTLEVTQIARIMARALRLNEDLTEAIALGHDLGHTPFGHAGETALRKCFSPAFSHAAQSVRVVDVIENMNLTEEVRDGILCHSGADTAETLEGILVKYADRIAYLNSDFDDACRAGILTEDDLPFDIRYTLGSSASDRIDTMVSSIVTSGGENVSMSEDVQKATDDFRKFMFETVYKSPVLQKEAEKAEALLSSLYGYYMDHEEELPLQYRAGISRDGLPVCVADYVASMTDRYAIERYKKLFIPGTYEMSGE